MERRNSVKGLQNKEGWLLALPLLFCLSAAVRPGSVVAQSPIINDQPSFGNKSAVFFQHAPAPIRLRSLEEPTVQDAAPEEEPRSVNITVPSAPPVLLNRRNIAITFPASTFTDAGDVVSKGLLYSDDKGENWHEYGAPRPASEGDNFDFNAPRDGEYWFALHLVHQDGTDTASRGQKFLIDTGSGAAAAANAPEQSGDRIVQGLLSLTQKNNAASQNSDSKGDPLTSRLNEMNVSSDPFRSSENSTANVPFPGKINHVSMGKTKKGDPAVSITWFQPGQCGLSTGSAEGKVSIERASSPEGPWMPVTEEAASLNIDGHGYWFAAGENDHQPFYLRTVSHVKMNGTDTEWIDTLPQPLTFPQSAGNVSVAETSTPGEETPRADDGSIKAWSDSGSNNERKVAGRDVGGSVVDKTSSVNQSSSASEQPRDLAQNAQKESQRRNRPQLTDPNRISVNPIFRFGFGVFTGKDNNGNPLPDYSNAGSAPAYTNQQAQNGQEPTLPSPPPKRPIWMSKREYEEHVRAYEFELQQARYAIAQREQMERLRKEQEMTAPGGIPGGQQAMITDASGKEIRVTEGSLLWSDEQGNLSTTPFPGQMNSGAIPEMIFPDQNFQNVSQPIPLDAQMIPGNSLNGPYSSQEQALGNDAFTNAYDTSNMSELANQSLVESNLPPRPGQQQ
ncbi:MAG: hypothetical protein ACOX6D_08530 [Thermoguttaceae bacterium]|jgi:hypothetical protein